jgi:periplasmic divalent cation tolerance protein
MSCSEADIQVVLVTAPDIDVATRIAGALVEERLAACVNLVPGVRSIYRWNGRVENDSEVLMIIKTRADRSVELTERVRALHPYDTPEVVLIPVAGGSRDYLDWVRAEATP